MENKAYYVELSRVFKKHHIESGPVENGRLVILLDGQSVGRIEKGAIRCIAPGIYKQWKPRKRSTEQRPLPNW